MKKIIRLTESDLTRIVKRTIREMRFSDDKEFDSENKLEDENFWDNIKGFDFGGPKDFAAILSDISDLIDHSENVNDFKMNYSQFTKDNQNDLNRLTDDEKNRLHGFINSVITRHNFN